MRLFIAIEPTAQVRQALADFRRPLVETHADVGWVSLENLHITLKFIGETDDSRMDEIGRRSDMAASEVPEFPVELRGLGRLPAKGPIRLLVAGVHSPDMRLIKIDRLLEEKLAGVGFPLDMKPFLGHLTLGRVRSNHGLNRLVRLMARHEDVFLGGWTVQRVALFSSTLDPRGSIYKRLHEGRLAVPPSVAKI